MTVGDTQQERVTGIRNGFRIAGSLLFGSVIFIGLPLLSWGLTDLRGFMGHPARLAYVVFMVLAQLGGVLTMPAGRGAAGVGEKPVKRQRLARLLLQMIPLAVVLAGPCCDRRGIAVLEAADAFRYLGLGMAVFGFALMQWAVVSLGRQFSVEITIQKDHRLVTDGIYRFLRHPRYLGVTLFFAGLSFVFRSGLCLLLVVALVPVLVWRIHDEENLLHQHFGTAWEAYARKTWRLIPLVY